MIRKTGTARDWVVAMTALAFALQSGSGAVLTTGSFTQPDFENGGTTMLEGVGYSDQGTGSFTLDGSNEGLWLLGDLNSSSNGYFLDNTPMTGNSSIYMNPKNSNLRGFVQHLDAGVDKWTGNTTLSIDYVGDGSDDGAGADPADDYQFFTFVAFAWNDTDTSPSLDIHDSGSTLFTTTPNNYNGLGAVFTSAVPTHIAETTHIITTDQTGSNPWLTTQVTLDLGVTGYDNFAIMVAADGGGIWFDNLQVIPEPSHLALLGIGGMAFCLRRRRHAA